MNKKTTIQRAIFAIEEWRRNESAEFVYGLNTAINILIELYPDEKKQIEDAYTHGCMDQLNKKHVSAENYYSSAYSIEQPGHFEGDPQDGDVKWVIDK